MDFAEHSPTLLNCPDCRSPVGELHKPGCDIERCRDCGQQKLTCGCELDHTIWTGEWPETIQDVKAKYDALLGMEGEWDTDYSHHPSVVYRSPSGFPFVIGMIYKGIGNVWTINFGQPLLLQKNWLEEHAPTLQQKEIATFRRNTAAATALKKCGGGFDKWVGRLVKIGFDTDDEQVTKEWMWVRVDSVQSGRLVGTLDNHPAFADLKYGDSVNFTEDEIAALYVDESDQAEKS
jgi:hypothetical protein